ncbi:MAG TPA: DUF2249 domain-containing protein [Chitinophagaceae bacterium]|jgi:uncharacterized protein (DUF2249 family)|nr:DUF2249 domain-containing protein [Chitinophagaceae bacterium]
MIVYRDTKIAQLIKANKDSIEAIAAVAKPFEKLRNPLLRKLLAGRTTLAEAARMGKCEVQSLAEALKPLGFEFVDENRKEVEDKGAFASAADFMRTLDQHPVTKLDVTEDLASGQDPLKKIMATVKTLPPENVLELINSFEPTPLISLLAKKGYEHFVERKGPEEVHTYFKLKSDEAGKKADLENELPALTDGETFAQQLAAFGTKIIKVDVSEMEMPMPMVTILEALATLADDHGLSVTHKRIPVFLFSELKERNFSYLVYKAGETDVRLLIYKQQP